MRINWEFDFQNEPIMIPSNSCVNSIIKLGFVHMYMSLFKFNIITFWIFMSYFAVYIY